MSIDPSSDTQRIQRLLATRHFVFRFRHCILWVSELGSTDMSETPYRIEILHFDEHTFFATHVLNDIFLENI